VSCASRTVDNFMNALPHYFYVLRLKKEVRLC
jgi:hypothetical protein